MTGYGILYSEPYYLGGGTSVSVPHTALLAIDGHPYMPDFGQHGGPIQFFTIPNQRDQFDQSDAPGENTLTAKGLWRRAIESWHFGAGQEQFDRKESNQFRFDESFGIDVSDKWVFSLLPLTRRQTYVTNSNVFTQVAGTFLYYTAGQTLRHTQDISTYPFTSTNVTGLPAVDISAITSDGFNVWVTVGASGIYRTTRGGGSAASNITGNVGANPCIGFARGRLVLGVDNVLYDVTALGQGAGGALPSPLFTSPNTDLNFVAIAEGQDGVYALGVSGDVTLIYRMQLVADGSGLDVPIVFAELRGETGYSLHGLPSSHLCIGTDRGVRFAEIGNNGLTIGPVIETLNPVRCFDSLNEFVWYGNTNMATNVSGLGRLNLKYFSSTNVPSYFNDLQARDTYATLATGQYLSAPDATAFAVTDLDVRWYGSMNDWTPAAASTLASQWTTSGNNKSWYLWMQTNGRPSLTWYNGAADITQNGTVATGFSDGTYGWVRATLDVNDGGGNRVITFYTSTDGITWTTLSTHTVAGTTSINNSTAAVIVGARDAGATEPLAGKFGRFEWRAAIDSSTVIASPDATNKPLNALSFLDDQANVWTLTSSSILANAFSGDIQSVSVFQNRRVFTVSGKGMYVENTLDREHFGYIQTGSITFNIPDLKIAMFADVGTQPIDPGENMGMHEVQIAIDKGAFNSVGLHTEHNQPFLLGEQSGKQFNFRIYIHKQQDNPTVTQSINNFLFRQQPAPEVSEMVHVYLLLSPLNSDRESGQLPLDPEAEILHLHTLRETQRSCILQVNTMAFAVTIEDVQTNLLDFYDGSQGLYGFGGTSLVKCKVI